MDILFWSGGKDAYLAYEFYRQDRGQTELKLVTTYTEGKGIVPHQNIRVKKIKEQAEHLDMELIPVPLPAECPNKLYMEKVNNALRQQENSIDHLVFGDWHLQDIRSWREEQFNSLGYDCLFPIWKKPLDDLLSLLLLKPVEVRISAVAEEFEKFIRVGEKYNQHFIRQLPKEIDPMGEKGEFHTEVVFKSWDEEHPFNRQPPR